MSLGLFVFIKNTGGCGVLNAFTCHVGDSVGALAPPLRGGQAVSVPLLLSGDRCQSDVFGLLGLSMPLGLSFAHVRAPSGGPSLVGIIPWMHRHCPHALMGYAARGSCRVFLPLGFSQFLGTH